MKQFLIIYIGRCGSTFLQSLLDSHQNITCKGELLHPGSIYNSIKHPMIHAPEIIDNVENFPVLPEIVFNKAMGKDTKQICGFKLSIMHFFGNIQIMEKWIKLSKAVCIHIKRNSLFDLYISMKLAQKNNAWTSKDGKYSDYNIDLNLEDFLYRAKHWEYYDQELARIAQDSNGTTISYESLNEHTQYICQYISKEYLGLNNDKHIFSTTFEKQKQKTLSEIIGF